MGDVNTVGLVSREGSLDWLCLPRLDSPSVFAALLDEDMGGRMWVGPAGEFESSQSYRPDTNILQTQFVTPTGRATLTDFMPVEEVDQEEYAFQEFHRIQEVVSGTMSFQAEFSPRFDYARAPTRLERRPYGVMATSGESSLALSTGIPLTIDQGAAFGEWQARAGDQALFVLRYATPFVRHVEAHQTARRLAETEAFWQRWVGRCSYGGPWKAAVRRSALALKLLTYGPTGALSAAATTSLPEAPGGPRNWDYRFSWVRDSAFAMRAFLGLGYTREARRYLRWLRRLLRGLASNIGELKVGYGLEGETNLPEVELDHLRGYLRSRPVRIGNQAFEQFQLDIFGSVADAVYEAYGRPEGYPDEAWRTLRGLADFVKSNWRTPDHGIWEIRGPRRRYTHSALMCWVALDRAIRVADVRGHPEYEDAWRHARDDIRDAILSEGWSERRQAFVQTFGSDDLDASLLLIPLVGFLPARDPRVISTLAAIGRDLGQDPFIHRYRTPDGLDGQEGAFLLCSFWMVQALAHAGETEQASARFEALHRLAGPLGLFSEQVDIASRRPLGNFPQALTHLALIQAALSLEKFSRPGPGAEASAPAVQT